MKKENYLKLTDAQLKRRELYVSGDLKAKKLPQGSVKDVSARIHERTMKEEVCFV